MVLTERHGLAVLMQRHKATTATHFTAPGVSQWARLHEVLCSESALQPQPLLAALVQRPPLHLQRKANALAQALLRKQAQRAAQHFQLETPDAAALCTAVQTQKPCKHQSERACGSSASACSRDSASHCEAAGPLLLSHGTHRFCTSAVPDAPGPASAAFALIARGCACGSACRWTAQPRPPRSKQAWLGVRASLIMPADSVGASASCRVEQSCDMGYPRPRQAWGVTFRCL